MKVWGLVLVIGALVAGWAQQGPRPSVQTGTPAKTDEQSVIHLDVTRVNMLFTVQDRKGHFVTNLTQDDFELVERKRPQVIQEFHTESDLPLRIGILIDTSNSIRDRFKFEQAAATQFIRSVMQSHNDRGMVISFDTQTQLISDLTDQPSKLEAAVNGLRPGGGTSLYDAIYFGCRDKLSQDQPQSRFRRAIVVLSDGEDNQSHYTRDQALEMAQRSDVIIFAISTNISRTETDGDKILTYFAQNTGGRAYFPFKIEDLEQNFENIHNELRHQYVILYKPDPLVTDGQFHPFTLSVKGHKELLVRVKPGYYAPKM